MSYKRFTNLECPFFPCHKTTGEINCLFCFCPLYPFDSCPGEFTFTDKEVKDCSNCNWVHTDEAYDVIIDILIKQKNY